MLKGVNPAEAVLRETVLCLVWFGGLFQPKRFCDSVKSGAVLLIMLFECAD